MKKLFTIGMSFILIFTLLVGCSSTSNSESSGDTIELSFFHRWPTEPKKQFFEEAVKEFEASHPNIKIKTEAVLNDSYKEKIRVVLGSKNPPDVFFSWSGEFAYNFVRANQALDLTGAVNEDKEWSSQIIESQFKPFTLDGKIYGVPWSTDGKAFFYNKSIFNELNLEVPKTWSDFITVSEKIKDAGITPISFGSKAPWTISHYIGSLNQLMVPEDVIAKDYDRQNVEGDFSHPGYVKALEKFMELEPYFNKGVNSVDHQYARELFIGGKAAIGFFQLAEIGLIEPTLKEDLGVFNIPTIEGGKGNPNSITAAPEGIMISSKTKHPEEAMEFVKFLTSKEKGIEQLTEVSEYSAVKGTTNSENASPLQQEAIDLIVNADKTYLWLDTALDIEIVDAYLNGTQQMLGGNKTPEEVMSDVQEAAKEVKASSKN
ncbi:raffinose/stachyose/melibiose transport system substrate-binding protein [Bacillus pakistanensis]|uniref:Raffinose/stachyose/melibiose transport system substrate-binding protein n=1 Tax=Rossellomorea pakistanensis TaxID=992288 RepID=A0ABS2NKN7_9BACI|nr:extracellular solute-binding protein [Bacillus pakistanensis]MBM7588101.1 raffinose/stachyose/melibiose transport system substrate-binding protein [Bacillus pakistanensis]